jgi:FeS assembly SUF system protein
VRNLEQQVIEKLREIYDPEIPVNLYDLGLIYKITIDADQVVWIEMTLTTPACPVAQTFPLTVEEIIRQIDGVTDAKVELVWDPPWSKEFISDLGKAVLAQLGIVI